MREIAYQITDSKDWLKTVNQFVPSTLSKNQLVLDEKVGKGEITIVTIQGGLHITFIDIKLNSSLKLIRNSDFMNNHFILNFYISKTEIPQKIKNQEQLEFENYGVLLASGMTASESLLPPNLPINIFNITFSKDWLQKNVLKNIHSDSVLHSTFVDNKPIYLFENLDYTFHNTYQSILKSVKHKGKIWLEADILKMLTHFFNKIESRPACIYELNINSIDIKNLIIAKNNIEENWDRTPSNEFLAQLAGMSLSKFKKLFKQLFRESPYQYYLTLKMNKAMELLVSKEHSVSDVGYILGYSNLSQFSKAFKKVHNILPKEVNILKTASFQE